MVFIFIVNFRLECLMIFFLKFFFEFIGFDLDSLEVLILTVEKLIKISFSLRPVGLRFERAFIHHFVLKFFLDFLDLFVPFLDVFFNFILVVALLGQIGLMRNVNLFEMRARSQGILPLRT